MISLGKYTKICFGSPIPELVIENMKPEDEQPVWDELMKQKQEGENLEKIVDYFNGNFNGECTIRKIDDEIGPESSDTGTESK